MQLLIVLQTVTCVSIGIAVVVKIIMMNIVPVVVGVLLHTMPLIAHVHVAIISRMISLLVRIKRYHVVKDIAVVV